MDFLSQLWQPIVLSAVIVWIASFIMHMVLPHHKGEFKGLADEPKFFAALQGVARGQYMFPWGTMADMKNPEFVAKQKSNPNGTLTVWPGPVNMGRNMGLTFLLYLVIGVFVAYLASHTVPAAATYLKVFQICGTAAFMAHGFGWMGHMIWFGGKGFWAYLFDSLVFGCLTAGTFGWLMHR